MTGPIHSRSQVSAHVRGDVAVLSLRGELDCFGACVLQAQLSEAQHQGWTRCVADLAELVSLDRIGLGVLVRHNRKIREQGGSFALAGPQAAVLRVLAVTGLLGWFEVHATVDQAVAGGGERGSADPAMLGKG
jgi:anti-sigma B factor antagonist